MTRCNAFTQYPAACTTFEVTFVSPDLFLADSTNFRPVFDLKLILFPSAFDLSCCPGLRYGYRNVGLANVSGGGTKPIPHLRQSLNTSKPTRMVTGTF